MSTPIGSLVIRGEIKREAFCDMSADDFARGLAHYTSEALKQNEVRLVDLCEHPDNADSKLVYLVVCLSMQPIPLEDPE